MMKRILITAIAGAVLYLGWGAIAWFYYQQTNNSPGDSLPLFLMERGIGGAIAAAVLAMLFGGNTTQPAVTETESAKAPAPVKAAPAKPQTALPARNDAITLLATLQREARFVDIVKEPLADYSDAQVGAAARDVLRDCGAALDRIFDLQPVLNDEEGASLEIPKAADASKIRISGSNANGASHGSLVHHGWEAKRCELAKWTGDKQSAMIVAPAELETK